MDRTRPSQTGAATPLVGWDHPSALRSGRAPGAPGRLDATAEGQPDSVSRRLGSAGGLALARGPVRDHRRDAADRGVRHRRRGAGGAAGPAPRRELSLGGPDAPEPGAVSPMLPIDPWQTREQLGWVHVLVLVGVSRQNGTGTSGRYAPSTRTKAHSSTGDAHDDHIVDTHRLQHVCRLVPALGHHGGAAPTGRTDGHSGGSFSVDGRGRRCHVSGRFGVRSGLALHVVGRSRDRATGRATRRGQGQGVA